MNESVHKKVKQEMLTICSYLKLILKYKSSLLSQMQKWNLMLEKLDDCASYVWIACGDVLYECLYSQCIYN